MKQILDMFIYLKKTLSNLKSLLLEAVGLKISISNLSRTITAILGALAIQSTINSGYDLVFASGRTNTEQISFFFQYIF